MLLRALIAFLALPGVVGFLLPPVIIILDPLRFNGLAVGYMMLVVGAFLLLWCVRDFLISGKGTLAPWDPPKRLVEVGLYRLVRNPMYVSVLTVVVGWALAFGSSAVLAYAILLGAAFHIRVITHEEPWLARQFRDRWVEYSKMVPRWFPRFKP